MGRESVPDKENKENRKSMKVEKHAVFSGNHKWETPTMSLEVWFGVL